MKREHSNQPTISRLCTGRMRVMATVACIAILGLAPGCATNGGSAESDVGAGELATTAGLGVGSFLASVVYAPAKLVYATGGLLVGGLSWIFSGGNADVALGVIRPAVQGDYVITPDQLRGDESIEFVGRSLDTTSRTLARTSELPPVSAPPPGRLSSCSDLARVGAVRFGYNDAALRSDAKRDLQRVAATLEGCPGDSIRIEGHTDTTGEGNYNDELSLRRAQVVRDYLLQYGVDPSRVEAVGLGASSPVSSNETQLGRAANRRAVIALR